MKKISKIILGICCSSSLLLSSCIEETFPTNSATDEQLTSSSKATEALLWAMPAFVNDYKTWNAGDYDWGYGSIMHVRDVMTEEMVINESNYDHYSAWEHNQYIGPNYLTTQWIWNYFWKFVQTSNKLIAGVDPNTTDETLLGYLGATYGYRAFIYLDMARMFEFLENDKISSVNSNGNDVLHLTVPIVTESITEEEARNNPRVSREKMLEFIEGDLDKAEEYIKYFSRPKKTLPDLACIYGLKARLYMWVEDYAKAKEYARKAIDTGNYVPTNKADWTNTTSGFNDISATSWMWGASVQKEDDVVKSGIINWTSWMSGEAAYGYAGAGPVPMADVRFYNKISDKDFRKLSWKAPKGSALESQNEYCNPSSAVDMAEYASLKFRPGSGNVSDYNVGSATSFPLMRIEEMYFIEAEAAAHLNASDGVSLINSFMKGYRYPSYECKVTNQDDVVEEIVFQKRVELWGEGQSFFDIKRLNLPVTRAYEGSMHHAIGRFNTTTRPAWMNICIVQTEENNNKALLGYENPDPSDCYKAE